MSWSRAAFPSRRSSVREAVVPAGSIPTEASLLLAMYAGRAHNSAGFVCNWRQSTNGRRLPLLILGTLAGAMQLLDAGIGLFQHDLGKFAGPLFIAVLQFFAVYLPSQIRADHARKPSCGRNAPLRPGTSSQLQLRGEADAAYRPAGINRARPAPEKSAPSQRRCSRFEMYARQKQSDASAGFRRIGAARCAPCIPPKDAWCAIQNRKLRTL